MLIAALADTTSSAVQSRIHTVLSKVASLKTYRLASGMWAGQMMGGYSDLQDDNTHSTIYEGLIKYE